METPKLSLVGKEGAPDAPAAAKVAKFEAETAPLKPKAKGLPVDLPSDVAAEMVKTYQANRGGLSGMRAAYRLFLDRVEL